MLKSSDVELQGVFDFTLSFAAAIKNYTLYPQDHAIARKHLLNLSRRISKFLSNYDRLRLDVEKNTLLYDGDIVYRGVSQESDIAYLLSRDGVKYLEFLKGIELWEIQSLLKVINSYRVLDEENDGDIVTALWEQEYPHIQYKAIDILSLDAPAINLSSFKVAPDQNTSEQDGEIHPATTPDNEPAVEGTSGLHGTDSVAGKHSAWHDTYDEADAASDVDDVDEHDQGRSISEQGLVDSPPVSIAITAKGDDLWTLSPLERYELEKMVAAGEEQDDTDNVIDILLIILVVQNNKHDFVYALDFLQDRFMRTIKTNRFDAALKVIRNLKTLQQTFVGKKEWALPLLDDLFDTLSQPESLRELKRLLLNTKETPESRQMKHLWSILGLLAPRVLFTIGPLAGKAPSAEIRQSLIGVIIHHAQHDPQILADIVGQLDEELCLKLMPVAQQMKTADASKVFTRMALHPSESVRRKAFEIVVSRDTLEPVELFPLINDPDKETREKILLLLGRERNEQVENRLLSYLEEGEDKINNKEHILACYGALGNCGSDHSIPFLKNILMEGSWSNIFSLDGLAHKQGAANALHALRIDEADSILKEGAGSILPDIRLACRKAIGK
ncbi:MAG: hypothetical protein GQ559_07685 [Desulfobulbaceae bacterium]|nr:hypothetical protein [Desulfobulbaceae bacterium]